MSKIPATASLLVPILTLLASPVAAQWPGGEPVQLFDGRVRLGGEVSATFGTKDDEAFFNYTDYERNALRTLRAALSAAWQPAERIALLGEVRSDDLDRIGAYAAYVRVRPWKGIPLDVQAGRIPPVFGSFGRRPYQSDRMLIGYPIAYQYLTSLRPDSLPATADDLLQMRGRGWLSSFPVGSPDAGPGLPLISSFRWDTGVQARWTMTRVEAAAAVTTGTLSNPRVTDDNGGKQLAARIAVRPLVGLVLGTSASRGAWISDDVFGESRSQAQTVLGADLEYSRDYWLIRSELVWSRWSMPFRTVPAEGDRLGALGVWVEGRYRLTPRLYLAARADGLSFSRITGAVFGRQTWDAPVTRFEIGGGYAVQRNLILRAVAQMNRRDGGRIKNRTFFSTQVAWWF